jgi:hypothetical protein
MRVNSQSAVRTRAGIFHLRGGDISSSEEETREQEGKGKRATKAITSGVGLRYSRREFSGNSQSARLNFGHSFSSVRYLTMRDVANPHRGTETLMQQVLGENRAVLRVIFPRCDNSRTRRRVHSRFMHVLSLSRTNGALLDN